MVESLGVMEMVMLVKSNYPRHFHFLKGNHENIMNEHGGGNYPFMKFTNEGAMVTEYSKKFLGDAFLNSYYRFEKNFPLLAVGRNFMVSHAEPKRFFPQEEVIGYRNNGDVVEGLTWTDNGRSQPGSVQEMIGSYIKKSEREEACYFGGHRPVVDLYSSRAEGKYIQIHNPNRFVIASIKPGTGIDLNRDIVELENGAGVIQ